MVSCSVSEFKKVIKTLDKLACNKKFVCLARKIVASNKESTKYVCLYSDMNKLLKCLCVTEKDYRVTIIEKDGTVVYDNDLSVSSTLTIENHNTRPEVATALYYRYGNPADCLSSFPEKLRKYVVKGYGFDIRKSNTIDELLNYVAKTLPTCGNEVCIADGFTLRVSKKECKKKCTKKCTKKC